MVSPWEPIHLHNCHQLVPCQLCFAQR
uniref:Uncharacterized protein n=1 Tax=Rhizophora mucronata TaxID=61149 RepID=A0A2P2Q6R0_RHIMU